MATSRYTLGIIPAVVVYAVPLYVASSDVNECARGDEDQQSQVLLYFSLTRRRCACQNRVYLIS